MCVKNIILIVFYTIIYSLINNVSFCNKDLEKDRKVPFIVLLKWYLYYDKSNKTDYGRIFMMKKYMGQVIPAAITLFLILIFVLLVGQKVYATNLEEAAMLQRETAESTYITEIKEVLNNNGFGNCGVNMTKATDEMGEWEYTVIVYHHSFDWMESDERAELEKSMESMGTDVLGKISLTLLSR